MKTQTCIIIVNMNGKNLLKDCLDSIKTNMPKDFKVIMVDNNSNDGSKEMLKKYYSWVDIIKNKSDRGFSGANNDGIKYAYENYNPNYYYFLSNDTKVTQGFRGPIKIWDVREIPEDILVKEEFLRKSREWAEFDDLIFVK